MLISILATTRSGFDMRGCAVASEKRNLCHLSQQVIRQEQRKEVRFVVHLHCPLRKVHRNFDKYELQLQRLE